MIVVFERIFNFFIMIIIDTSLNIDRESGMIARLLFLDCHSLDIKFSVSAWSTEKVCRGSSPFRLAAFPQQVWLLTGYH